VIAAAAKNPVAGGLPRFAFGARVAGGPAAVTVELAYDRALEAGDAAVGARRDRRFTTPRIRPSSEIARRSLGDSRARNAGRFGRSEEESAAENVGRRVAPRRSSCRCRASRAPR